MTEADINRRTMRRAISLISILLGDIFSLILAFYTAYFLRVDIIPLIFKMENAWFFPVEHFYKMYFLLFLFILIFYYEKLYSRRYDFLEEVVYIARAMFIAVGLIGVVIYLSRKFELFSRTLPLLMMLTGIIIVPTVRFVIKKVLISTGMYIKYSAVLGKPQYTAEVLKSLQKMVDWGYEIVRVVDPEKEDASTAFLEPDIGTGERVETIIIVSKGIEQERMNDIINRCENHVKEIKIVSESMYLKTIGVDTEYVDELLVMRMSNNLLSPVNRLLKQVFDLLASLVSLLVLIPIFAVIALIILLDSRGPVFFIQERFGKDGKRFRLLKFRTMYRDADAKLKEYLEQNPQLQEEWSCYKKLKSYDPRVTRFGKFLRRFSLDEAPQVFNVILGDMSIVGPRPYLIRETEEIAHSASIIFRVKSGLTGLWQIRGRNELSFETRLKLDEFYVRNWSFFLDLMIILKTFGVVFRGKGAY